MKEIVNNKKGFTLIELIMVIVILGILAAVAVPKFIDLKGDAQVSRRDNLTGALRSAVNILHANYILHSGSAYTVTDVVGSVDAQGLVPVVGGIASITAAKDGITYTWVYTALGGVTVPAIVNDPS